MKNKRHEKILELIKQHNIETQEELASMLNVAGFDVTQATVSRDIKKLNLVKVKTSGNHQKYMVSTDASPQNADKLVRVLKDAITDMEDAQNILVIKTVPGMAMAAAAAIDSMKLPGCVGTIAGDDTIMIAVKTVDDTHKDMQIIKELIFG